MALVRYSKKYWFPNGVLAANLPAAVFPEDSNFYAPLFSDISGTPLPNPTSTDGAGVLTFWAEEGSYWVHIDSEAFAIDVGLSLESADLSTGVATGGQMDIATATSVTIGALVGYIVDNNEPTSAEITPVKVDTPVQTVALDVNSLSRAITFWLMDASGNVIQQGFPPSPTQRRTHLALGITLFDTGLGTLTEVQTQQVILGQPVNQLADLMDALGSFNATPMGNLLTPLPGTLSFEKSAGEIFSRGFNHFNAGVLTDTPHLNPSPAQSPAVFRRVTRFPESPLPPSTTTIDPTLYDLNGVLTPVGGGTNTATVQRVYAIPVNNDPNRIAVQYGQFTFPSLNAAVLAIGSVPYVPSPVIGFGCLIGYIAVIRTATNLADPAQATFVRASKFPTP